MNGVMVGTEPETEASAETKASRSGGGGRLWPFLLLGLAVALLFLTSPRNGDFAWSDAPRHAMDGAFYRDFFAQLPLGAPKQFAVEYYLQYPALTILFYPPLFAVVAAGFFALLGVSHFTAQLTVMAFYLAAAWGAFRLCRRWLDEWSAFAASLLFVGVPEVALWGRQVMLEVPAYTFVLWSGYYLFEYLDRRRPALLYVTAALFGAGLLTKQTVAFMLPVFAWTLWRARGGGILRDRHVWGSLGALGLMVLPLVVVMLKFGQQNAASVSGAWLKASRVSFGTWVYYLRELPEQMGWPALALAVVFLLSMALEKGRLLPKDAQGFLLAWLGLGYVFFSWILFKERRHTVLILFPLVVFAVAGLRRLLPAKAARAAALLLACGTFGYSALFGQVPYVRGYREAADYVAEHAPPNSVVLFSGERDGSFIFNLRAREDRRDLTVLRSDKLLVRVAVSRDRGIRELAVTEAQLAGMINDYGISHVVNQPNFWDDLEAFQRLQRVLQGGGFRRVRTIAVESNMNHTDRQIEIWENAGPVSTSKAWLKMDLPIVGLTIEGPLNRGGARKP